MNTLPSRAKLTPRSTTLWALLGISVLAGVLSLVIPNSPVGTAASGALMMLALVFSVIHGSLTVGWRGIATFGVVGYVIALVLENSSVFIGFPFGFYEHFVGGPRILEIPVIVPLIYLAYGWPAWVLACQIVRGGRDAVTPAQRFTTPLVAAFILTGWDFSFDAIYATVQQQYAYGDPGGFFGVPVTNYLGWLLTGVLVFGAFELLAPRLRFPASDGSIPFPRVISWFWMIPTLSIIGLFLGTDPNETVSVGDRSFLTIDVVGGSLVAALMSLVFVGLISLTRVTPTSDRTAVAPHTN